MREKFFVEACRFHMENFGKEGKETWNHTQFWRPEASRRL